MKFSIIPFAFLFATVYAFSFEDNVGNSVDAAEESHAQNKKRGGNKSVNATLPKSLPIGSACDTSKNECQCYGSLGYCGCGPFGAGKCMCRRGTFKTYYRKFRCPNKEEWAKEFEPKSIPVGGECDRNKNMCQCYGKRSYCECDNLTTCYCIDPSIGSSRFVDNEKIKRRCSNKEQWANETTVEPKSIPLEGKCDIHKSICQCYGKKSYCQCLIFRSCVCADASIGTSRFLDNEVIKRNCPNKEEWASEDEPESIPVGGECDINKSMCQCYGKRSYCECVNYGTCYCIDAIVGSSRYLDNEIIKRNCSNKGQWANETTELKSTIIPLGGDCDIHKSICQCYGKKSYCQCLPFRSCHCADAGIGTSRFLDNEVIKRNCPNKEEWASEDEPRSIPVGGECDINKSICQCYGKRSYCGCVNYGTCYCIDAAVGSSRYLDNEIIKRNCSNKGQWANETTELNNATIPLQGACDINKSICQCYGKKSYCQCLYLGSCHCAEASIGTSRFLDNEEIKRNCPNKEEWACE